MKVLIFLFFLFISSFSVESAETSPSSCHEGKKMVYLDAKEILVKTNEVQLFCRVFGKGDPVIVIHGGPGLSQDYLLPNMAKLAETNLVIFYDQRGSGLSAGEINAETINLAAFVDDLEAIRKTFGYEKVSVLGHSWGGFLAMQYGIAFPQSIHKLILLNSMPPSSEGFSLFVQEWMKRMAPYQEEIKAIKESSEFAQGDPATVEKYYRIMFRKYCYDPEKALLLNLCMSAKASIDGGKVNEILRESLLTKPFNFYDQVKKLRIPTLIIHGEYDVIPHALAQELHENIHGSQYVLIKKCGHFPYVETPNELFQPLNDFLQK